MLRFVVAYLSRLADRFLQKAIVAPVRRRQLFFEENEPRILLSVSGDHADPGSPSGLVASETPGSNDILNVRATDEVLAEPLVNLLDEPEAIHTGGNAQRLANGDILMTRDGTFNQRSIARAKRKVDFSKAFRVSLSYEIQGGYPEGFAVQFSGLSMPVTSVGETGGALGVVGNHAGENVVLVAVDDWVPGGSGIRTPAVELVQWEIPGGGSLEKGVLSWRHVPNATESGEHRIEIEYQPLSGGRGQWRVTIDGEEALYTEGPSLASALGESTGRVAVGSATGPAPSGATQTFILNALGIEGEQPVPSGRPAPEPTPVAVPNENAQETPRLEPKPAPAAEALAEGAAVSGLSAATLQNEENGAQKPTADLESGGTEDESVVSEGSPPFLTNAILISRSEQSSSVLVNDGQADDAHAEGMLENAPASASPKHASTSARVEDHNIVHGESEDERAASDQDLPAVQMSNQVRERVQEENHGNATLQEIDEGELQARSGGIFTIFGYSLVAAGTGGVFVQIAMGCFIKNSLSNAVTNGTDRSKVIGFGRSSLPDVFLSRSRRKRERRAPRELRYGYSSVVRFVQSSEPQTLPPLLDESMPLGESFLDDPVILCDVAFEGDLANDLINVLVSDQRSFTDGILNHPEFLRDAPFVDDPVNDLISKLIRDEEGLLLRTIPTCESKHGYSETNDLVARISDGNFQRAFSGKPHGRSENPCIWLPNLTEPYPVAAAL